VPQAGQQSRSNTSLSTRLSNPPQVPSIPQNARTQHSPQGPAMLPQQRGSTQIPAAMQRPLSSQFRPVEQASNRSRNSISSRSSISQRPAETAQNANSRRSSHRNADSASSTSSRASHNLRATQGIQQNSNATAMDTAPAILILTGLPPNMTPPSPIAEFIRPTTTRTDTPVPVSPTGTQVASLHRRSGSGDSSAPRSALGAHTASSPRRVASTELIRSLPPVPGLTQSTPRGSLEHGRPSPRRSQRPILNRLATIASVVEHQRHDDFVPERIVQSANTTPETPVSRRQWWRIGNSNRAPLRPESRIMQYAPVDPLRHAATAPIGGRPKEKDGGMKCVVM
jgi:hypothetical protein